MYDEREIRMNYYFYAYDVIVIIILLAILNSER